LARERVVREGLNIKMHQAEKEDDMKPLRYKGGKVLYRSIEKPLKLYSHGMRIVDTTNPNNQKEMRNKYVAKTNDDKRLTIKNSQSPKPKMTGRIAKPDSTSYNSVIAAQHASQQQAHANDEALSIQLPQSDQAETRKDTGDDGVAHGSVDIKEDGEVLVQ